MKKTIALALAALMLLVLLTACSAKPAETEPAELEQTVQTEQPAEPETDETAEDADASAEEETPAEPALPDGVYTADFNTDSSMFHANEACDGKGTLTVENGEMTIHVSLAGTSILNLFPGVKEDAEKEGAELLQPTTDTVTYSDGLSDEVFGFDIPVPTLDEEFDLALIGKKGTWYDHKVSVSNPVPVEESGKTVDDLALADGTYTATVDGQEGPMEVSVTVEGGALTGFFDPIGRFFGLDGVILTAFLLALPANELVMPLLLLIYADLSSLTDLSSLEAFRTLLIANG